MNTEREKFEEWVRGRGAIAHKIAGNESNYYAFATQCKWQAWQARAAIDSRGEGVPVGWLTSSGDNDVVFSWDKPHPVDDPNPNPVYLTPQPALVAAQQGVPEGWQLVPKVADENMIRAIMSETECEYTKWCDAAWNMALAAAPSPAEGSV